RPIAPQELDQVAPAAGVGEHSDAPAMLLELFAIQHLVVPLSRGGRYQSGVTRARRGDEVSLTEGRPRGEEAEAHHRSAARLALDRELAAVGEDEVLHDRQPEAGPAELTGAGAVDPVEALGDAGQVGGRDADPGIRDPDLDQRGPDAARTHRDAAAGRRVLHAVVDEVDEDLGEPVAVGPDRG